MFDSVTLRWAAAVLALNDEFVHFSSPAVEAKVREAMAEGFGPFLIRSFVEEC